MIKYLLCPGHVTSKYDKQVHYITADALAKLYGVNPRECVVAGTAVANTMDVQALIQLHPRYHGDYSLPGSNQ